MWQFLKKILSEKEGDVTVIVFDENDPDAAKTFKLKSLDAILLLVSVTTAAIIFTIAIFYITPLSSIYQQRLDDRFRDQVIEISDRVTALQDSLYARDVQLNDLKGFVRTVPDTLFEVEQRPMLNFAYDDRSFFLEGSSANTFEMLTRHEIISSSRLERELSFPAPFPIDGSITQRFSVENGHYGIDIAAETNSEFRAIADGVVVSAIWTINYGYVLYLQHADGMMSVYKHGARLLKDQGDFVLQGDILGLVGDRGVLSSGSHLHLELWKDGTPQNPLMLLQQ
ncbi:MAG: M23 family metallopeptidase [Balneolaceae bacterium]|nr:MAG: M23 family metallopeptidase [Balneolaceae bacterium]